MRFPGYFTNQRLYRNECAGNPTIHSVALVLYRKPGSCYPVYSKLILMRFEGFHKLRRGLMYMHLLAQKKISNGREYAKFGRWKHNVRHGLSQETLRGIDLIIVQYFWPLSVKNCHTLNESNSINRNKFDHFLRNIRLICLLTLKSYQPIG